MPKKTFYDASSIERRNLDNFLEENGVSMMECTNFVKSWVYQGVGYVICEGRPDPFVSLSTDREDIDLEKRYRDSLSLSKKSGI